MPHKRFIISPRTSPVYSSHEGGVRYIKSIFSADENCIYDVYVDDQYLIVRFGDRSMEYYQRYLESLRGHGKPQGTIVAKVYNILTEANLL